MSFLDKLFGRKPSESEPEPPQSPDELREELLDAAQEGWIAVETLCEENREAILASFESWTRVPPEARADQGAMHRHAAGLLAIAQVFAESFDDPSLMERLTGGDDENPMVRWGRAVAEARDQIDEGRFEDAVALLEPVIAEMRESRGTGVDAFLWTALASLGRCRFELGDAAGALQPVTESLERCRELGADDGIGINLGNLYDIHRYLGEGAAAADVAREIGQRFEKRGDQPSARRSETLADLLEDGMPSLRVVAYVGDVACEIDELPPVANARVRFGFERDRPSLMRSDDAVEEGKELAERGSLVEALAAFRRASQADPLNPAGHYQAGLTLLLLGRADDAVAEHEACERLAPGWFHCRAWFWLAREIAAGRVAPEVAPTLAALDNSDLEPWDRVAAAREALQQFPNLAAIHLALGEALLGSEDPVEAEAAFRAGLACGDEPDVTTRLLVGLAATLPQGAEREAILERAIERGGNLVAGAMARIMERAET